MIPGYNWRHSWWRFGGRLLVLIAVVSAVAWGYWTETERVHVATVGERAGSATQ